jgi:hypothetical protein
MVRSLLRKALRSLPIKTLLIKTRLLMKTMLMSPKLRTHFQQPVLPLIATALGVLLDNCRRFFRSFDGFVGLFH